MAKKNLLVRFSDNYADEFDVDGFKVYTPEEWEDVKEGAKKVFAKVEKKNIAEKLRITTLKLQDPKGYHYFRESEEEFYFGTNEAVIYSSYADWLSSYTVTEITPGQENTLDLLFGSTSYGYGIFIEPEYYDEEG